MCIDRVDDVDGRQAVSVERLRIEIHHDLARLAAVGQRHRGALNRGELGAHEVIGVIEKLFLGQHLACHRELENRHARRAVTNDQWRRKTGGQGSQQRLGNRGDLRHRHLDLGARMKKNLDDTDPVHGLRLHVLDVVDRGGKCPFAHRHYSFFHVLRGDTGERPDDGNDGNIDVGENIGWHALYGYNAQHDQQERNYNKGVRAPQRQPHNPHSALP